ncbi:MAG: hypothetical protein GX915_04245 [Clostridiales bacterium]|nr:hypothetical protein [Clostridiales bacterium]
MKHINKKFILIGLLLAIFLLVGCDKIKFNTFNAGKDDQKNNLEQDDDQKMKEDAKEDVKDTEKTDDTSIPVEPDIQPKANTPLLIYTIDSEKGEIEPVTAMIPDDTEITAQLIIDKVVEAMADKSLQIGIESVTAHADNVIVSFYSDQPPLANVGAGIELAILDAIGQSLIDNLPDCNKIIYQVEKEAYVSGHMVLDIDEAYFTR